MLHVCERRKLNWKCIKIQAAAWSVNIIRKIKREGGANGKTVNVDAEKFITGKLLKW